MASQKKLTPKQRAFVEQYLIDLNATAAYKRAGFKSKGHSAEANAAKLLKNSRVAAAIEVAMKARSERTLIGADNVLRELARIAFFDIGNALTPEGALKPLDQMDEDTRRAIAGFEVASLFEEGEHTGFVKKVKIADKLRALELLGKHLGLFEERIKVSGDEQNPLQLLIRRVQGSAFNPVKLQSVRDHIDDEQFSTH